MARDQNRKAIHGHLSQQFTAGSDRSHRAGLQGKQCLPQFGSAIRLALHPRTAAGRGVVQRIELPAGAAVDAGAVDIEGPRNVGSQPLFLPGHRLLSGATPLVMAP
jgi:hypothetical protein